jgi:hypothetical protein
MKRNLCGRLERLEEIKAAADRAKAARTPPSGPSVADIVRERLRVRGFVQTGNESLAEAMARAFGMSIRELRADLERRAAGGTAALQSR